MNITVTVLGEIKLGNFFYQLSASKHLSTSPSVSTLLYYIQFRCTVLNIKCLQKQGVFLTYCFIAQENQNNHALAAECGVVWELHYFEKQRNFLSGAG